MEIRLTENGYLQLPAGLAHRYFPEDVLVALLKTPELWLLPLRGAGAGGLLLKQRNRQGDRSVLIWEQLPPNTPPGLYPAFWDEARGALRVALRPESTGP
ncbi:MAG TPA: hydrogenase maturation protease [Anaerolineae bacterium]|nr:hydrogenase maturation protease [Anaerolineae bacterium]HMR68140.1 hydrogenase maturation protease [Anaerolineae bacterium]